MRTKNSPSPPSTRLAIVDTDPEDYGSLLAVAGTSGISLHFLTSGSDALLFARRWSTGLWVINSRLSDMSGFELAGMLRALRPNSLVFMIGDEYMLEDELQTLTLGLAKYLCKPLEPSWVLPQTGDWCIPLPTLRGASRQQSADPAANPPRDVNSSAALVAARRVRVGNERIIVPFGGSPEQRPAA
jgi:CheY-like chemotaxis protein